MSQFKAPGRFAAKAVAIFLVLCLFLVAREPAYSLPEQLALAHRFAFTAVPVADPGGAPRHYVRNVAPSLERISAWISSVGAAVALADIDGDGLPNDVCYVDTRTDRVVVAPVPGSGERYAPFVLSFSQFPYDKTMAPMGCLPGNFKEDGQTDLLVYFWGRGPVVFLHRPDGGHLGPDSFVAQEVVKDQRWYTNAATVADVDGDGHLDLILGNYFPDDSRVLDSSAGTIQQMQHSMSYALNGGGMRLLLWAGAKQGTAPSVTFHDVSNELPREARTGWTLAAGAADLDGRQLPEIYLANDFGPDRLLYNESQRGRPVFKVVYGSRDFLTPKSKTLGRDSFKGMGVDFADIDHRGVFDFFVSNITEPYALEESNFLFSNVQRPEMYARGEAPFVDKSEQLGLARGGWGWDAKFGDFDDSGALELIQANGFVRGSINRWPELQELAMGNDQLLHLPFAWPRVQPGDDISGADRTRFLVRDSRGIYTDIAQDLRLESIEQGPSRGIATADCFGDGRLDFAIANQWGDTVFYRNRSQSENKFIGLHLRLPLSDNAALESRAGHPDPATRSRPAIGATATLVSPDGQRQIAQVDGGNGHSGKRSPDILFGLGNIPGDTALEVDLRWRSSQGEVSNQTIHLTPGWHTVILGTAAKEHDDD